MYDGGREIELKILNKVKISLFLISTVAIGSFATIIFKIDFMYALLLESVISSVTFVTILITLTIQASTAQWLVKKIKLEI